jgi:trehalose 6-phosphate synthase/phosphatase
MVLEIRPRGIHKGLIIAPIVAGAPPGSRLVAIGDDPTDEDLFEALPPDGISLHVGPGPSRAAFRVGDVHGVRRILAALLDPGDLPGRARA